MKWSISLSRFQNAGPSILVFFTAQAVAQLMALIAGLLVVRLLSIEDYAIYALVGASIGAAAVTSDLGVSSASTTLLSRASDPREFEAIQAGATSLRLILGIISSVIILLIFLTNTAIKQGLGTAETWILVAAMSAIFMLQASATLARAVLASQRKLSVINRADPFAGLLRVVLLGAVFLSLGSSPLWVPVLAWLLSTALVAVWLNTNLPRVRFWPLSPPPPGLLPMLWPLLPGHIYYLITGLIPVLTLGAKASPETLAAYWALGRLGMVLASFKPLLSYVAHPYVSRGHDRDFFKRSLGVLVATSLFALFLVVSGYVLSDVWLLLLGPKYADLESYVWIALGVAGLKFLAETFYRMRIAGGQTGRQYLTVAVGALTQIAVYALTPMQSLHDIYLFVAAPAAAELVVYIALYLRSAQILHRRAIRNG